jgi:hypothetical protein
VILDDDFADEPLKWAKSGTGSGYDVTRDTSIGFEGPASLKLVTRSASAAADDVVTATRIVAMCASKIVRVMVRWRFEDADKNKTFTVSLIWYDGTTMHKAQIRYDAADGLWQYLNNLEAFGSIGNFNHELVEAGWHYLEFDVDFSSAKSYVRMIADSIHGTVGQEYYQEEPDPAVPEQLQVLIETTTVGAAQATAYVGRMRVSELDY